MACSSIRTSEDYRASPDFGSARSSCFALFLLGILLGGSVSAGSPSGEVLGSGCTGCHGAFGVSRGSALPTIAGIDRRYQMRVMLEFKNGERPASIMDRIAQGYSDNELRRVSIYFSNLPWRSGEQIQNVSQLTEAESLHNQACEECHKRLGRYQDRDVSRIAGQGADYLFMQMKMYQTQQSNRQPEKMQQALKALTDQQMSALARFYSNQR